MASRKHKTKLFKKTFQANADDIYKDGELKPTPMMTEEVFVPLMGQLWARAKARYKKRYEKKYLTFAGWVMDNADYLPKNKTIAELFTIWEKEK